MNKPVVERITLDIVSTLQGVTVDSGYEDTLVVVRPNPSLTNLTQDGLTVVTLGDSERDFDCPQEMMQFTQEFAIAVQAIESEQSTTSIDERLNRLQATIETVLTKDVTRGGKAEDTILYGATRFAADPAAHDGAIMVHIKVLYRTVYNQPSVSIYDAPATSV